MRRLFMLSMVVLITSLLFVGCSQHVGYIGHRIATQIQLGSNNFKVIDSVTGEASAEYIFGFGPSKQNILDQARRDMINKANLVGSSKAVVNITTDIKIEGFLFWRQKTAYVSGEVVEFINK